MKYTVTATQALFDRLGARLRVATQASGALFFDASAPKPEQAELDEREAQQLRGDGFVLEPVASPAQARKPKDSTD